MSDDEQYLALVAEHGPCQCATRPCSEAVGPGERDRACPLCVALPDWWPCPEHDDHDYPQPVEAGGDPR